jgi:hypothetical protein
LQQNTTYIETEMNKDHFWNIGTDEDGHHRFAQMQASNDATPTVIVDPALATGMDLVYFSRFLVPTTETAGGASTNCQPFVRNGNSIMQLLGIRSLAVFNNVAGNVAQTLIYAYNCSSVVRQTTGRYALTFATALPNSNYLMLGGGVGLTTGLTTPTVFSPTSNSGTLGNKNTLSCLFLLSEATGALNDNIQQGWIVCFGG